MSIPGGGVRQRHVADLSQENGNESNSNASSSTGSTVNPGAAETSPPFEGPAESAWRRMSSGLGSTLFSGASGTNEDSFEQIRGYDLFKKEKWDDFPRGFPRLSSFVSSSDELSMDRSFKTLHNRLLLHYQVEITELEKELFRLDKEDDLSPGNRHRLYRTKHEENWDSEQRDLLQKLRVMLKEYDEMVLYHKAMQDLPRPSKRSHMKYWNYIWRTRPLSKGYWDYICWADDFVTLSGNRTNQFQDALLDHISKWRWSPLRWGLRQKDSEKPTADKAATYYSKTGLQIVSRFFLVVIAVGIVLVPANILFLLPMSRPKMAVTVAAALFAFGFLVVPMTRNVHEVFAVIAAYGAVLVMFEGNLASSNNCNCPSSLA